MFAEREFLPALTELEINIGLDRNENNDDDEEITHTLPFKCIGAGHERNYQDDLEQAHMVLPEHKKPVQVRIRPEPDNPRDVNSIAIDLDYGSGWKHVGYITRELCKYLHSLIVAGDIVDVYIEHIVFRMDFRRYGFYPKIMITRRGQWEPEF